jgi:hypothetical protein
MADEQEEREADWKAGSHTDADGKRWKLDSMSYEHLERTITHQSVIKTTFLLYFPKAGATLAA